MEALDSFWHWFYRYKKWVTSNPQGATEMEAVIKWGSYILAGRLKNSTLLCEIVYSGSRLFEMFNDFLIKGTLPKFTKLEGDKLKLLLTVLEYVEVLVEVAAVQLWGEAGRWAVVAVIQLTKCIGRFVLLLQYKTGLVATPPVKPLDRRAALKSKEEWLMHTPQQSSPEVMRLPHSGRLMRTLAGAPPMHKRTFCPPKLPSNSDSEWCAMPRKLSPKHLTAEVLHILRPLAHLGSLYLCGQQSWVPWLLSLGVDVTSLRLYEEWQLTAVECRELVHRRLNLLYYLVRSPAFHAFTHPRLHRLVTRLGHTVPFIRPITQPLLQYIPEWQRIYAYTWS